MSSRVDGPRSGAPIGGVPGRHKQDHERRNQELQKRSLDGPLSKSLTEDPHSRARKKAPLAGKSFMKATSSSSLKKSMDPKDASPPRGRKRDPSPSKVMSKSDHQVLRRNSSRKSIDSSNRKSMDCSKLSVFDRLSKSTDSNKETSSKTETQVSKTIKRRSGVFSDSSGPPTSAVPLRRDSNGRRSARSSGKRDSKAEMSEKHKGEEKPESSDKDAKDECRTIKANESQQHQQQHTSSAPAVPHVGAATATAAHQVIMGGANEGAAVTGSHSVMPVAVAAAVVTVQAPAAKTTASTGPPNHSQQRSKRPTVGETNKTKPKDTYKAAAATNKPTTGKVTSTAPITKPEPATAIQRRDPKKIPETCIDKPPINKIQRHAAPAESKTSSPSLAASKTNSPSLVASKTNSPSVAAVSRLAERVITGQVKPNKGHDDSKVLDDDKDVCDDDKAAEDREFYRIKVQTRLVTYENNTLVIKNTSNPEQCHESCADTDTGSLQTSSAEAPPVGGTSSNSHMPAQGHHDDDEVEEEGEEEGGFTRSHSLRLKMSNFMNKGKNFLTDVYSSTHQSLQPHLSQLPEMTRSFQQKMSRSMTSECSSDAMSIMSISSSISSNEDRGDVSNLPITDTDSGYYSIHTTPDQGHTQLPYTELDAAVDMNDAKLGIAVDINDNNTYTLTHVPDEVDIQVLKESVQTESDVQVAPDEELEYTGTLGDDAPDTLINDDWLKRCIINCSCQCRRPKDPTTPSKGNQDPAPPSEGSLDSGHGSAVSLDSNSDAATESQSQNAAQGSESSGSGTSGGVGICDADVSADTAVPPSGPDGRGECQCECHSGANSDDIQCQIPLEVQDLLDADHARMWWTITGNFGNILPIDWSKTYTRQQYLPVLNLNETKDHCNNESDEGEGGEEEDVAQDLDLHHLILTGLNEEPVKSAEEVIREIDDIMQEGSSSEDEGLEETMSCSTETQSTQPEMRPLPPPLYEEKLKNLSVNELNEHYMELEVVIRQYSETLINQLALRDELEYEKELKNSFISLLLQVQNKRRNFNVEKKQKKKYLTTVIPYDVGHGPPSNQTLQILIKILTAINEDSPTVPTLLTDYILKVLCPS